ncbi:hypothetical protein GCM10009688_07750 [Arthrobacter gandavensis]|uniref:Uncharacterized protein n=1 Tax=Arthrobacter gandavensis TaxID=169960 RepID=A0ABP5A7W3_9MICC
MDDNDSSAQRLSFLRERQLPELFGMAAVGEPLWHGVASLMGARACRGGTEAGRRRPNLEMSLTAARRTSVCGVP